MLLNVPSASRNTKSYKSVASHAICDIDLSDNPQNILPEDVQCTKKQVKNNSLMAHIQLFLWTAHLSFPFRYGGKSKTAYINAKEG